MHLGFVEGIKKSDNLKILWGKKAQFKDILHVSNLMENAKKKMKYCSM